MTGASPHRWGSRHGYFTVLNFELESYPTAPPKEEEMWKTGAGAHQELITGICH